MRLSYNLNYLITSNLYDKVIVPLVPLESKNSFRYFYGFSKYSGCKIDFDTFIKLIEEEKIKITLTAPPKNYNKDFYKPIFKICKKQDYLPSFVSRRVNGLYLYIRLAEIASSYRIPSDYDWIEIVSTKHPEHSWDGCAEEVMQIIKNNKNRLNEIARELNLKEEDIFDDIVTSLWDLKIFGYKDIHDKIILECLKSNISYGYDILKSFCRYLIEPISDSLFGYMNYDLADIKDMHFLRVLPKDLAHLWEDILSSYPLNSSVVSNPIKINLVELDARELLSLLAQEEEEMKNCVLGIKKSLNELNIHKATEYYKKINEIIVERYNKEIEKYRKGEKVVEFSIRFGENFTNFTKKLSCLLLKTSNSAVFKWIIFVLVTMITSEVIHKMLKKLKPKDVTKWFVEKWPFSDPGLPYVIWSRT